MLSKLYILFVVMIVFTTTSLRSQEIADSDFNLMNRFNNGSIIETTESEYNFLVDSLINYAQSYLKTPYRRGTSGIKSFDCSGFSSYIFRQFGYDLNRTSQDQARNGYEVHRDELQKGDLVFFKGRNAKQKRIGHVGIVYEVFSDGTFSFIHASCKYGVTITEGDKAYYKQRFVTARRIFEEKEETVTTPSPLLLPLAF